MKTTRRNFIGTLAGVIAVPAIGSAIKEKNEDWFEDILVDRYYVLQGGQYGDTGGWGCPGYSLGAELIENMKYWEQCRYLEHNIESVEERGFYFTPSSYLEDPWREYDRIYLTKRWMMEFYNRHKDEPVENWKKSYDKYLDRYLKLKNARNGISHEQ